MEDYFCLLEKAQTEVIHSSAKAKVVYLNILKAATKEIMIIFPTINALSASGAYFQNAEAHYGRMWAENNNNADARNGATFYFTLPIVCKELHSDNNMIVC